MDNEIKTENGTKTENAQPVDERPEYKGTNLEEAISLAEHRLKLPREKFNYEIVTEKTRLFGLKCKEIVIRAWLKAMTPITAAGLSGPAEDGLSPGPELPDQEDGRTSSSSSSTVPTRRSCSATTAPSSWPSNMC